MPPARAAFGVCGFIPGIGYRLISSAIWSRSETSK